ncbi:MAG: hypothetical protein CV087_19325 [Candidatus Brocadia sp. WS118]|nr:MAG: hypothetical protein CV087_19325 [Candidatus Brocadia sp. WS118]
MKQYFVMVSIVWGLTTIFAGCGGTAKKSDQIQTEHLGVIEEKIHELELGLSNLNNSAQELGKRVDALSQKTTDTDSNYSKLLTSLDVLSSKVELKDSSFESILAETQKTIKDLEKKMDEMEKAKIDLQNQLMTLQTQRSRITGTKIEQPKESMKEAKQMMEQGREMLKDASSEIKPEEDHTIKTIAANQEKEALQKLLDEALMLYRDGNYKGAIGKWEEVLVLEPENLEAKFNIEIANEKIKSISEK